MVASLTVAYLLGALGMLAGVAIVGRLLTDDAADSGRGGFRWLLIIPGFAALAYLAMALDVGTVTVAGDTVYVPRYVDWLVTTPVLIGYAGYVAGAPRNWILGVAAADAGMIVLGGVAIALAPPLQWVAFAVASLLHLVLLAVLYGVFPRFETNTRRNGLFEILQNHVGLLWIGYPVIWLASPVGFDLVSAVGVGLVITYLDVVAKVPYVYFIWAHRSAFAGDTHPAASGGEAGVAPAD